jgi:hypothetical protein
MIDQMKKEESIGNQRRSDRAAGRAWRRTWRRRTSRLPLPLWLQPYHSSHYDCQLPPLPVQLRRELAKPRVGQAGHHCRCRRRARGGAQAVPDGGARAASERRTEGHAEGKMVASGGGAEVAPGGGEVGRQEARRGVESPG